MPANLADRSTVALINSMGDDVTVVNAARVSFAKSVSALSSTDEKLIRYLARHQHWTPFSHVMVTLRIKMPVFVARQWFKHTAGLTRNEVSRRYVSDEPEYYLPTAFRSRPNGSVKQGSGAEHPNSEKWRSTVEDLYRAIDNTYEEMIIDGVAPEQARAILPVAHMTEFYETGSLAAYARIAKLRIDDHAQKETREVAQAIADLITPVAPVSWRALTHTNTEQAT